MNAESPSNPTGRRSAEFYRRLCQHAPGAPGLVATDVAFTVVSFNDTAGRLLGAEIGEMLGQPLLKAVPENRRRLARRLLERTLRRGLTNQFDVRMAGADGAVRDLLVVLSPIPGDAGEPPEGVAAWIVDETHRRKLTERLSQAEKMASLGTLASGVAHHFNNILGGVATFVDYALTSGDVGAMKRALQMTSEAAARASKITRQLLSFAKVDAHRTDLADLTEVVLTFVHLVERPLAERSIRLHLDLRPAPIVAVEANRMHQVLGNLLTNAEEAMPEGGQITLTIERADEEVRLSFADTGGGIQPEHLPLVFEPFFTTKGLHATGERANPGLGLSVVHGIVTDMGGRIEVRSEPGKGATFTLSFPARLETNK